MSIIASPTTDTADAVFPSSTSWVDELVYPVDPVTVLPHVHLFRLYRGEQIVVPSAALDPTILATALRGALPDTPSSSLPSVSSSTELSAASSLDSSPELYFASSSSSSSPLLSACLKSARVL